MVYTVYNYSLYAPLKKNRIISTSLSFYDPSHGVTNILREEIFADFGLIREI